jgi:hypothetical protein
MPSTVSGPTRAESISGYFYWDVSRMKKDFGIEFDPRQKILEHLDYYIALEKLRRPEMSSPYRSRS